MLEIKRLALRVASCGVLYRKYTDGEMPSHLSRAKKMRYQEALAEFEQKLAEMRVGVEAKNSILQWAYDVVNFREEVANIFQQSPPARLFNILLGYGKSWNLKESSKKKMFLPHESRFAQFSVNSLTKYFYASPELETNEALEALSVLAGAVRGWSFDVLVDIKIMIEEVRRGNQGSYSKEDVINILDGLFKKAQESLNDN